MKIVTIIGARPQFVKAAVVSREFAKHSRIKEVLVHTGQHFDKIMSESFFEEMDIPKPDYNLNIHSLPHGAMTGRMIEEIEKLLLNENPDYVLVYGDTNSTLAGAVAAKKLGIEIIHVEAGVRNFDNTMPEEINRILTDRISDILFCVTDKAVNNLKAEGLDKFGAEIINCGDIMYDAALFYSSIASEKSDIIERLNLSSEKYVYVTVHRASNTDNPEKLRNIIEFLNTINKDIKVIFPIHPRTRKKVEELNLTMAFQDLGPVGYFDSLELVKNCQMAATDSGGVVREAYYFEKNSLFLLENSVWPELIENGFCVNTKMCPDKLLNNFKKACNLRPDFSFKILGNGNAVKKIINYFLKR